MIDDFYKDHEPAPTDILGLRLRPLALGHIILLHRAGSAFVIPDKVPTIDDLAISILICSLSYEDGAALFEDPTLDEFMLKWADRLTGMDRWLVRSGILPPRRIDYGEQMIRFAAYIKSHWQSPKYSYTPGDFRQNECPDVQLVKVALMRDMHFPEAEILNCSWLRCLWDFVTLRALKGEVTMYNEDEFAAAQTLANELAEKLMGKGVPCR